MSQVQQSDNQAAQIMQTIQKMLSSVGTATGATGGGGGPTSGTVPPMAQPTITFDPRRGGSSPISTASPRPYTPIPPTGGEGLGEYSTKRGAVNAGLTSLGNSLSGIFNTIGQKEHAKKAALAENYLMQINGLLGSGDPQDKQKAMMILEDPKIRKILKTGLEYVPLEEEVPPEAHGVQSAIRKISGQADPGMPGKIQKNANPPPGFQGGPQGQRQPIVPQPSQEQQLKAAMTSALLQKIKQDPASAISMMGQSQLSGAEQHAAEFYKSGLGMTPEEIAKLTAAEKLQGLKLYEAATTAAMKAEVDMYKTQVGYKGKVDAAKIFANSRTKVAEIAKSSKDKNGKPNNYAAGAKIYEDLSKKYLDIVEKGKGPDGKPLTDEQKKVYQQKADALQRQADEYLNQAGDAELMEMFMKSIEEPDASDEPDEKPN